MTILVKTRLQQRDRSTIVRSLLQRKTAVYPTETSYGLGCDATNPRAVRAIFTLKGRKREQALPIIVSDLRMLSRYVSVTRELRWWARRFWPGPLTLVVPVTSRLPRELTGGAGTIAVRISSHPIAQTLVRSLRRPMVATSANRSGRRPLFSLKDAASQFPRTKPDVVIDAGTLPRQKPSTILDLTGDPPRVLRRGRIRIPKSFFTAHP